jgi:ribose transport system substrate-binding protein
MRLREGRVTPWRGMGRVTKTALAVGVAAMMVSAAGCGDSSSSSSASGSSGSSGSSAASGSGKDNLSEAKALVAKAEEPQAWKPPGPAFDAKKAAGKSAWYLSQLLAIPFQKATSEGFTQGIEAAGARSTVFDGKGAIPDFSRGLQQATAQGADAIISGGFPSKLVSGPIKGAKDKGIPVISSFNHDPGPPAADAAPGVVAEVSVCYTCAGKMMADFVTADSGGKAEVIVFGVSDTPELTRLEVGGFRDELEKQCPDCKMTTVDAPSSQWATRLASATRSAIQKNPKANYVVPIFDGMALFMVPAIHQAGAQNRVKLVSFNATPAVLEMLKKGDVVAADVGTPNVWGGWGHADQALRAITGAPLSTSDFIPMRLFTKNNIDSIDLKGQESTWYGPVDYQAEFKKLWGLS